MEGPFKRMDRSLILSLSCFYNFVDLIKLFDLETILIYNALLLKRKVLIFHHDLDQLVTVR